MTMKKFKTGLLTLAVVLGVTGAFVSKIHAAPKVLDTLYDWQHFDRDGTPLSDGLNGVSISTAQGDYGCTGTSPKCAVGTDEDQNTVTIFYNN
jgi:hypothetical protein